MTLQVYRPFMIFLFIRIGRNASIEQGFAEENKLFYILTNSRGFTAAQTEKAHKEIAEVVDQVAKETGKEYLFISRSDSTLRGHYPLETTILKDEYEKNTGKKDRW